MEDTTHAGAQHFCKLVGSKLKPGSHILIAGCGAGHEAHFIYKTLQMPVTGVDVELNLDEGIKSHDDFVLQIASVLELPFEDNSFDAIFYHHVIEHVPDPKKSIEELARVLKPGGMMYVGTPNRHRMVAYVGAYQTKLIDKIWWNLKDYGARLRGRFRNEYGAHAGFSEKELDKMLKVHFSSIQWLTQDYLNFKYGSRWPKPLIKTITWRPVTEIAAPAIYAIATK